MCRQSWTRSQSPAPHPSTTAHPSVALCASQLGSTIETCQQHTICMYWQGPLSWPVYQAAGPQHNLHTALPFTKLALEMASKIPIVLVAFLTAITMHDQSIRRARESENSTHLAVMELCVAHVLRLHVPHLCGAVKAAGHSKAAPAGQHHTRHILAVACQHLHAAATARHTATPHSDTRKQSAVACRVHRATANASQT